MSWEGLDRQMQMWSPRLRDDLRIGAHESNQLATTIAKEVSELDGNAKQRVRDASKTPLASQIDELKAFQLFTGISKGSASPPEVRALNIYMNYICFVYLGDSCFKQLRKELPRDSTGRKCCKFLTDNPVRAFRNAFAHGNWHYLSDFSGLEYWARPGSNDSDAMVRYEVSEEGYNFWQQLARCVGYVSIMILSGEG